MIICFWVPKKFLVYRRAQEGRGCLSGEQMSAANEQCVQRVRPGETDPWKEHVANQEFED